MPGCRGLACFAFHLQLSKAGREHHIFHSHKEDGRSCHCFRALCLTMWRSCMCGRVCVSLVQRIHPSANRWDERSGRCRRKAKKGSHEEVHGQLWKLRNIMTGILRCSVPPCFRHPSSMDFLFVLKGRKGISDTVANKLDFTVVPTVRETGRLTIPFRRVPGRTPPTVLARRCELQERSQTTEGCMTAGFLYDGKLLWLPTNESY